MASVLAGLKPESVLKHFESLSNIPRGSGNEKEVSDFILKFGKDLGLESVQDEALNVIIRKPASKGFENVPGVIIQGHMDMVCVKNKGVEHDFTKDPIKLRVDGDMLYATGTTLGADNGIAVAMGMAILEDDTIEHPELEVLVTVSEETGMDGAHAVDPAMLKGKYIINIDSEEEGVITVSCAGGTNSFIKLPVSHKAAQKDAALEIEINGLLGGHSGIEIGLQRANANKLMCRLLNLLTVDFDLACIEGGIKHNAIPNEAKAIISVNGSDVEAAKNEINEIVSQFKNEFLTADPGLEAHIVDTKCEEVMDDASKANVIELGCLIPHGVQAVSLDMNGLIQTSTNFAIIENGHDTIGFMSAVRSSIISEREELAGRLQILADRFSAVNEVSGVYPAWEHKVGADLEKLSISVYKDLYGKEPEVTAIHAGLECGLLLAKMPNAEAISIGPDTIDVHSPNEHVSIPSVEHIWNYLLALLKAVK
ncbi:MAG: aminoacyl-histidine dipeptidase [Clostridioides sp.]|nr:aminoacyl-histidine dipeptidase [Clostridioides sp.]